MKKVLIAILALVTLAVLAILFFFKSDSSNPYKEYDWGKFGGECKVTHAPDDNYGKDFHPCDYSVAKDIIPVFEEIDFDWINIFDNKKSLPLMASAMIDIDNDGIDEVFVSGGVTQEDAIFKYTDKGFKNISEEVMLPNKPEVSTTFGAVSFDLDSDGNTDLILTGDSGVRWLRNINGKFLAQKIEVPLDDKSVPASVTLGDINRDGHIDMFVSNYIKLDKMEGQTIFKDLEYGGSSLMMINNGDNTFRDVTAEIGLSYVHNTFMAVMVDVDGDGFLDLVVAHDTGEVRTYRNDGGSKFIMMPNPLTNKYAYPMGIAVGDYDNDGDIDFFFSNTGSSVPTFLARGDLEESDEFVGEWILFRNDGDFKFSDVADQAKVADFEFSWGAIFEDFNLDGKQDLVVAENYVDFPPHKLFKLPGRFLVQVENGEFAAVEDQAGAVNKNYAITPLSSDWNQDGYPDLFFANLNGKMKALMNKGGDANYLALRFEENVKNAGAHVILTQQNGEQMSDVYVIGEGLASDNTSTLTFGLGKNVKVKSIEIKYADGTNNVLHSPEINVLHKMK